MFSSLLIANRGEIACRIIRTAKRMGLRTIAVYSDADADAPHTKLADEALHIGPSPAAESYLKIDRIIEAAKRSGAEAIHPGYGFLSENADFADACLATGIIFVGPPADAIRQMGHKSTAKALMVMANVPVVPGYHGEDQSEETLVLAAADVGYPVLIKAAAGGGGKGMRRVDDSEKFTKELKAARREAMSAFGDDHVLIEKFVTKPRHIEVQVFADGHGNAVHLFERDCSVQRRHQKVIEEAPAPGMPDTVRETMGHAAVAAAKAINYQGAGTVEFIVDGSKGLGEAAFYFMEMNTRLQVEHPVTELITGLDLVEWQLRVASGEPLPKAQNELSINGHAVEARLYAENPAKNFFPQTGTLTRLRFPPEGPHVRVDSGVEEGQEIPIFYDPMIAKVVAWDETREQAINRLETALRQTRLAGVNTNLAFLAAVAEHAAFRAGDVDTGFIETHKADLIPEAGLASAEILAAAVLAQVAERGGAPAHTGDPYSPWDCANGWRMNLPGAEPFDFLDGDTARRVILHHGKYGLSLEIEGDVHPASYALEDNGDLSFVLGGTRQIVHVVDEGDAVTVLARGYAHRLERIDPSLSADDMDQAGGDIKAPLPGKITVVMVLQGDAVAKNQPLMTLEAMKMEHTMLATRDGTVTTLNIGPGDQVAEGTLLVSIGD
ncbi:MAG: acetyl/propionyl/methylcrotonyl-CoA carboxylase subunit alpha [Proteobacteria bacterium]|nr:acetyl/propionyl/methylcrotonyl-CoA carboxylase subunit alpha [Pseudomonadota bacterium]